MVSVNDKVKSFFHVLDRHYHWSSNSETLWEVDSRHVYVVEWEFQLVLMG